MSHVDGVFSDRRSKRRALGLLTLVAAAAFAHGWVRDLPRETDARAAMALAEPGVLLARPIVDTGPEPLLQAAAEPPPSPIRRAPAPAAEPEAAPVVDEPVVMAEAEDPTQALSAEAASVEVGTIEPLELPEVKPARR